MLEKDPEQRIASMRIVGAELESIIEHADSGVRQALDLIYRMLEREHEQTPAGMRLVGAKLGSSAERSPAEFTPSRPKPLPLAVDQFEKTTPSRAVLEPSVAGRPPERRIIAGLVALVIVQFLIIVLLLM
jgi:hypothetical protein